MANSCKVNSPFPKDLNPLIVSYLSHPPIYTHDEITCSINDLTNLSKASDDFHLICIGPLKTLKKIQRLVEKYCCYNLVYEAYGKISLDSNPQLLDALLSGCKLSGVYQSFGRYEPEIEEDIKEIIRLTPQSIKCDLCIIKTFKKVTPLMAACINKKIPLNIIEFLLEHGADPNGTVEVNGSSFHILYVLQLNKALVGRERFEAIAKLFSEYGYVLPQSDLR